MGSKINPASLELLNKFCEEEEQGERAASAKKSRKPENPWVADSGAIPSWLRNNQNIETSQFWLVLLQHVLIFTSFSCVSYVFRFFQIKSVFANHVWCFSIWGKELLISLLFRSNYSEKLSRIYILILSGFDLVSYNLPVKRKLQFVKIKRESPARSRYKKTRGKSRKINFIIECREWSGIS